MRGRRWLILLLGILLMAVAGGAWSLPALRLPESVDATTSQIAVERTLTSNKSLESSCGQDGGVGQCGGVQFVSVVMNTPSEPGPYTMLVTATLEYQVSRGDVGMVGATYGPEPPWKPLSPSQYHVTSSPGRTTTSFTWAMSDLLSNSSYTVNLGAIAGLRTGDTSTFRVFRSAVDIQIRR